MLNILKSVKKFAGFDKKTEPVKTQSSKEIIGNKINKISDFFGSSLDNAVEEFKNIRAKSKNLYTTNYDLGSKYLEEGNLKEAIFRFRITKKLFPKKYEAHYQLIICLVLNGNFNKAEKLMIELLEEAPEYKEKIDLIVGNSENLKTVNTDQTQ
ncbi:MAG: tetratricopeptide (TPR) repeat protein [Rickettsiales bacterium]|jgi:tetratricopeptide (TPR) repeat protein